MDKIVREFVVERDTKNTRRFQEVTPPDKLVAVGTLYIQKAVMPISGKLPDRIKVTIEIV